MLLLGLVCMLLGALAIVAAVFSSSGTVELIGLEMEALALFLLGVASGALILWGFTLTRLGTKRELRTRREHRQLTELSEKLNQVQPDRDRGRDRDGDRDRDRDPDTRPTD
ncbi:hypothetical protein [Nocardioides sp.]|uniref:hypothetical protein n=1 Tax=Nocardioides sp. TaxID=35761 RepID=UPI0027330129|nr:hypothetical protein [Nocardioides sp.]MDP3890770.1 hypothetical protein [Nocardioides sp.]